MSSGKEYRLIEIYRDFRYNLIQDGVPYTGERCKRWAKRLSLWTLKLLLIVFLIIFIIGPFIYKYLYSVQRSLVFLNFVSWPRNPDFDAPAAYGVDGAHNFYLTTDADVTLGVWHIPPSASIHNISTTTNTTTSSSSSNASNASNASRDATREAILLRHTNSTDNPDAEAHHLRQLARARRIIIYNHGNSGHRIAPHRVELYQVLRRHFHVICWDYRGYGDSSAIEPTEAGLVSDATFIYKWVLNHTHADARIFIWGHSLGTGVSTHMLGNMVRDISVRKPAGLFLESPFTSFVEEIAEHPFAKIFRPLPWFHYTIIEPMIKNGFVFASDRHIIKVDCPIIILHAEDDLVVPYRLGEKLYKIANEFRREHIQGNVTFVGFERKHNYGHKFICRAPEMDDLISGFVQSSIKEVEAKQLY